MEENKKEYTEKDLVEFGNYLLSTSRAATIKQKDNLYEVHDCDIANWKEAQQNND